MRYLHFLRDSLRASLLLADASRRAVRCCPAAVSLRVERLRALELARAPPTEVREEFEAALGAPLSPAVDAPTADLPEDHAMAAASGSVAAGAAAGYLRLLYVYSEYQKRRAAAEAEPAAALVASVREARRAPCHRLPPHWLPAAGSYPLWPLPTATPRL